MAETDIRLVSDLKDFWEVLDSVGERSRAGLGDLQTARRDPDLSCVEELDFVGVYEVFD